MKIDKNTIDLLKEIYEDPDYYRVNTPKAKEGESMKKSCECGSTAVGSPRHSDYCPMHPDYKHEGLSNKIINQMDAAQTYLQLYAQALQPPSPLFGIQRSSAPVPMTAPNKELSVYDLIVGAVVYDNFRPQDQYKVLALDYAANKVELQHTTRPTKAWLSLPYPGLEISSLHPTVSIPSNPVAAQIIQAGDRVVLIPTGSNIHYASDMFLPMIVKEVRPNRSIICTNPNLGDLHFFEDELQIY